MDAAYQAAPDVHVLPTNLPLPGAGVVLPVNAYVLLAEEPVLIDAGLGVDSDEFLDALTSIVDLNALRWVWLTHDDADHTGSIQRVLEAAPHARLGDQRLQRAANGDVVACAVRPGARRARRRPSPGRRPHPACGCAAAVRQPVVDRFLDEATGSFFSVDSFGALLPEATEDAAQVPHDALAGGMAWALADSPWTQLVDRQRFRQVLDGVRRLEPTSIFSSHLPAASGTSLERFLEVLASVPDAEPVVAPNREEFEHMLAAMTTAQGDAQLVGADPGGRTG